VLTYDDLNFLLYKKHDICVKKIPELRPNAPMAQNKPSSFKDQFAALKHIPALFRLIWRTNRWLMLVNLLLRLVRSSLPLITLFVAKNIVDEVVRLSQSHVITQTTFKAFLTEGSWLLTLIVIELGVVALSEIIGRGISLTEILLGDLFSNQSSMEIIRHAATLDLYQFEDPQFYDKLERARRQTTGRTVLMTQVFEQAQDIITVLFLGAGLLFFNPWLILILVLAVIPTLFGEIYFNQKVYSLTLSWTPERRELDYLRYIGASDETAKEIKMFGLAEFLANRFKTISDRYFEANKKIAIRRAITGTALSLVGTLSYYGAYIFIVLQTVGGIISLGTMTFLAGSFDRMRNMLQSIMLRFSRIAESALYLQDYFDFLNIKPLMKTGGGLPVPTPIKQGFTFNNVSFKYLNTEKYAVKNLSFELKAGEKLALVGENGAGKTTIVKLLARLYEPTEGSITLDGRDLKDYDPHQLREAVGVIFQDYIRFAMTASENIAIGKISDIDHASQIVDSANKSLADTVIEPLPQKYQQMLGKRFAGGVDLSGGQWQKIALARAYMRDAQLLILDEPTAALDARAEHEVFIRFAELTKGKSAVLISHRFSTVRMADRILFLENGQRLEMGTHDELMAYGGKYAELFNLQAKGYV
jgi:ATP-binding cassette, subfamily B, bacterial